jgi:hypothetical protein
MDIRVGDVVTLGHVTVESIGLGNCKMIRGASENNSPYAVVFHSSNVKSIISRKESDAEARVRLEAEVEALRKRDVMTMIGRCLKLENGKGEKKFYRVVEHEVSSQQTLLTRLREARAAMSLEEVASHASIARSLDEAIAGLERK